MVEPKLCRFSWINKDDRLIDNNDLQNIAPHVGLKNPTSHVICIRWLRLSGDPKYIATDA